MHFKFIGLNAIKQSHCHSHSPEKQRGFNLIENLVTLFVLSVGLLGVAGMQAVAMKTQQTSHFYHKALSLAQGFSDRVRANMEAAEAGAYDLKSPAVGLSLTLDADCTGAGCSPLELAGHDITEWRDAVRRTLPKGEAYVCQDSTPSQNPADYYGDPFTVIPGSCDGTGDTYVVHIVWDMDPKRDGVVVLTSDPEKSDGHFMMVFEP